MPSGWPSTCPILGPLVGGGLLFMIVISSRVIILLITPYLLLLKTSLPNFKEELEARG